MQKVVLLATMFVLSSLVVASAQESKPAWQVESERYQKEYDEKDYPGQERKLRAKLEETRQKGTPKEVAAVLHDLGQALYCQSKWTDAQPIYAEELKIDESIYPPDAPEIGKALYGQ